MPAKTANDRKKTSNISATIPLAQAGKSDSSFNHDLQMPDISDDRGELFRRTLRILLLNVLTADI